jgi:hypothetical protein
MNGKPLERVIQTTPIDKRARGLDEPSANLGKKALKVPIGGVQ